MKDFIKQYSYNPFSQYGKRIEDIISQKAYDSEIADMLRLSFPIMIEYYGHEYANSFFSTLKEFNFVMLEDNESTYDIIKKYTPNNITRASDEDSLGKTQLEMSSGVCTSFPLLEIKDGKISMVGKTSLIVIKNNPSKLDLLACFVHELSHALKSTQNAMNLIKDENGNLVLASRSGLSVSYSIVTFENGIFKLDDYKEINTGLEEGINSYDETSIINRILSFPQSRMPSYCYPLRSYLKLPPNQKEYVDLAYSQEALCAHKLIKECNFEKVLRYDQIVGTCKSEKIYDSMPLSPENNWKSLNTRLDLSVSQTYDMYLHLGNSTWLQDHQAEIIDNLLQIHNMLDECAKHKEEISLEIQ